MLGHTPFYFRSIRKTVVAFGDLFNDLEVVRFAQDETPKERFKVPLSYGGKEKYITRITEDPNLTKSIATVVPRIVFILTNIAYDSSRKKISTLQNFSYNSNTVNAQYVPVPFNFDFSLSIFVRNTEDGTQILEQILPFFTPDYTITLDLINNMDQKYDVPIILNSVTSNVEYEGDMQTTRVITWDLEFTAKGYIFPPIKNVGLIKDAKTNIYTNFSSNTSSNTVYTNTLRYEVEPNPLTAEPDDEYGFTETFTPFPTN